MTKKIVKGVELISYALVLPSLIFLSSCVSGPQPTNTPNHIVYRYLFPKYASNYHPGDTITLTWKAVPIQEQTNADNTVILKAEFPQVPGIHGDLSKPLIANTTTWSGKTFTMNFHVPKDMQKLTYKLVTSITTKANASVLTTAEGMSYITIE